MGAERAGAEVIWANDTMPEAAETFRANFPHIEFVEGDVSEVHAWPSADLVIGGYPCQSFSLGGNRRPHLDERSQLYREFARCLTSVRPKFFVAENVKGLRGVAGGRFLEDQLGLFRSLGYTVTWSLIRAEDFGVPQRRKRIFIVGVRRDVAAYYHFPLPTHGDRLKGKRPGLAPYSSHGDAIAHLPLWPQGEFYERPHDPEGHWAWYYMSRNRKAKWNEPSFTIVANLRHVTLHPASAVMKLTWSNLADGWKQRWDFSDEYEHVDGHPERPALQEPRRLSWRECALIQTFPETFEPSGRLEKKFEQVGNAVPPLLAEVIVKPLISGSGLQSYPQGTIGADESGTDQLALVVSG